MALRRPYTVAALCLVIFLLGTLCATRMRTDVLPTIDLPVVSVIWSYPGLSAEDMERRVVLITERSLSTSVDGIERIESQSIDGIGLVKIYFQPSYDIGAAIAQISASCNSITRGLPPGITPPTILRFNASNVPVAQLTLKGASEQSLFDAGQNFMRLRLFTIPGLQSPAPFGGRQRQVMVDIDPQRLAAARLSPQDIVNAIQTSNVILPAGTARIGTTEFGVALNGSPTRIEDFNDIPLKVEGGRTVLLGSVAHVHDGYANQTNIVRVDGQRATYLAILKKSDASTLAVVEAAREMLPSLEALAPEGAELKLDFDQSVFVRAAIKSVLMEALIAAGLVSLMILFFLGSWRSTIVVATSIPIAVLVGLIGLFLTGQTLNVMTLGGLALSIGMLVDDATVEVENIHRNHAQGKRITQAILDGARQVALPALAATSCLCLVFFPVVLLDGPARFLFVPLALAVVFPLAASYVLSRTLVPALARKLMRGEDDEGGTSQGKPVRRGWRARWGRTAERFNHWRDTRFERFQKGYTGALSAALTHRAWVLGAFGVLIAMAAGLMVFVVGLDFFPSVDTGQMRLHVRAPVGTRLEETERRVAEVETALRQIIPPEELATLTDTIGVPTSYNLAFVQMDNVGSNDAEVRVALAHGHRPTREYVSRLRAELPERFPDLRFYFQDADIVSQVLNFGLSSPIDIQVTGRNQDQTLAIAQQVAERVKRIPGAVDVRINQAYDRPTLRVEVDRQRALALNVTERDVANSLLTSLSSSQLTAPSSWVNPDTNVNYNVVVQTPLHQVSRVDELLTTPVSPASGLPDEATGANTAPYLGALAQVKTTTQPASIRHETVQPVVNVQCAVADRDLGAVARDIERAVSDIQLPERVEIHIRGQAESMFEAFGSLALGLVLAILLVYFLLVILFQSWVDPLIILTAVPGALVGILWMLSLTGTSLNVESFMGTIMAVGIAVSNSILMVSFANESRREGGREVSSVDAAREAARTRLRPVLMTALAMILGMLPMALGLGEGGDQNAPLGRAVIGGLLVATLVTLFVVPVVYSLLRKKPPRTAELDEELERESSPRHGPEDAPEEHGPHGPPSPGHDYPLHS
ncbi:MAG: efflux RND transporter permease subunit [Cystobacter sp.]